MYFSTFAIITLALFTVFSVVTEYRFPVEQRLRNTLNIDRDWWVPVIALGFATQLPVIDLTLIHGVFIDKFGIIALILAIAIMAEGLRASGVFRYLAYQVVEYCNGNTNRLILAVFLLTSGITVLTSNDAVILVLTPIIVAVCFQTQIKNMKVILLAQFIAANTASIGVLTGSPTNIIIAEATGIDFLTYTAIMVIPTLAVFGTSFLLLQATITLSQSDRIKCLSEFNVTPSYDPPTSNPEPEFTPQMRNWTVLAIGLIAIVSLVTIINASLIWSAVPGTLTAITYWQTSSNHRKSITVPLSRLPYGVLFFGMTFFIFAEALSQTGILKAYVTPTLQTILGEQSVTTLLTTVLGTGVIVNIFNDLPAAALLAQLLIDLTYPSKATEIFITQAVLVGLNIGTYITQVGALAGILWFNQLRVEKQHIREYNSDFAAKMKLPTRTDLLKYGVVHFVVAGTNSILVILLQWSIYRTIVGRI